MTGALNFYWESCVKIFFSIYSLPYVVTEEEKNITLKPLYLFTLSLN